MIESYACDFYTAPGFSAVAIPGNVTTTSLVVGNAMGTPNATTLGKCIKTITDPLLLKHCYYRGNTHQHCRGSHYEGM